MAKIDTLKEIVAKKKERIVLAKQQLPEEELKSRVIGMEPARAFAQAINKPRQMCLIAEVKKASPSKGVIRENFVPVEIAKIYEEAGVQAVSVLTEEDFFCGRPHFFVGGKSGVEVAGFTKDFFFEAYQI